MRKICILKFNDKNYTFENNTSVLNDYNLRIKQDKQIIILL